MVGPSGQKWTSIVDGKKRCCQCHEWLSLDMFYQRTRNTGYKGCGLTSQCKTCSRAYSADFRLKNGEIVRRRIKTWRIKRSYGVTEQDLADMWVRQEGKCAICGIHETDIKFGKVPQLFVDHDAKTGRVRGLLCHFCNIAIGSFKDNIVSLSNAIKYLENANGSR